MEMRFVGGDVWVKRKGWKEDGVVGEIGIAKGEEKGIC